MATNDLDDESPSPGPCARGGSIFGWWWAGFDWVEGNRETSLVGRAWTLRKGSVSWVNVWQRGALWVGCEDSERIYGFKVVDVGLDLLM